MQDYHQQIINNLSSGVLAVDAYGDIIAVNRAAAMHLHDEAGHLRPGKAIATVPAAQAFAGIFEEVAATRQPVTRREFTITLADGAEKEIGLSASLFEGSDGGFHGVIFLFTDMTERRGIERAAELNRQLAALGELTAGVVHELRNPLSVISGMAEYLTRKMQEDPELRDCAKMILEEAGNLEKSISTFLGFTRPYDIEPGPCTPDEIAERALKLSWRRAEKKGVRLIDRLEEGLPHIKADIGRAAQALGNIISNAVDVVESGGAVVMETTQDNGFVIFRIIDDGPGIDLAPEEDLFKPFFSKKEGGTGLGLAIAHRIITAHNGSISYRNRDDAPGACFEVQLPIRPGVSAQANPSL
jgi:PAS domain S-box-containing protein